MGRRSRRRVDAPAPSPTPRAASARRADELPRAPWHPVPLVELCVLAGLVLVVLGFLDFETASGRAMLVAGMALGSLGGLDTVVREHFAGYKSHSMLLAAVTGLGAAAPLWWTPLDQLWLIGVFVVVAAFAFRLLRSTFARRSGGLPWRA